MEVLHLFKVFLLCRYEAQVLLDIDLVAFEINSIDLVAHRSCYILFSWCHLGNVTVYQI